MLKLRLKRSGRKRQPSYRLVVMENTLDEMVDQLMKWDIITQLQKNPTLMKKKL